MRYERLESHRIASVKAQHTQIIVFEQFYLLPMPTIWILTLAAGRLSVKVYTAVGKEPGIAVRRLTLIR